MLNQPLALAMRPKSFDEMIGAEKLIAKIRAHFASGRIPKAWMFAGQTGSGKTTIARIMAVSLQCTHETVFGQLCSRCRHNRKFFDIVEINASDITGIDALRDAIQGAYYAPKPGSRRRVYILDEMHQASKSAQNLLLKFFEDCPRTTNWIICTTEPEKIIRTLRRRCTIYVAPSLGLEDLNKLVRRGLEKIGSELSVSDLAEKLMEKQVTSPALVLNAVEKYASGGTAEEASDVEIDSEVDTHALCRSLIKGDWEAVAGQLQNMKPEDVRPVQAGVCRYLQAILLGDASFSSRTEVVAKSIIKMSELTGADSVQISALSAHLYQVAHYFSGNKR